ncbi:MAG: serine protease, partial [Flavobacteriaceae bacterium]|nr:serine protease [Flavobacteriaceae bacterium]
MRLIKLLCFFVVFQVSAQQGGMWIPSLLEGMNEDEMQSLGSKLTAKDIYDVNNSSLKDAIGHFNGGCTSEVISDKGLVLTNHHCGFSQIQSHSSLENDYIKNGFWAMSLEEELPNEGLFIEF